jgi:hypothetical protein
MRTSKVLRCSAAALVVATIAVASSFLGAALAGGPQTFSDVNASHPFYDEIEWLADTGITSGYPDGTFRPGAPVTRQAMAAYLERVHAGISTHRVDVPFSIAQTAWHAVANCPDGKRAIAGGGATKAGDIHVTDNGLNFANTAWEVRFELEPGAVAPSDVTVTAWVTCVPATPAG